MYEFCNNLPESEKYALISQMQRAAVSIPSNIAEGYRRGSKEFRHFVSIAAGSAAELETQLYICSKIYNSDTKDLINKSVSIQKMLYALRKTIQ